jgi:hypothetical protein
MLVCSFPSEWEAKVEQQRANDLCRPAPRPEEEFARVCIQEALSVPVCGHDDGSKPGMYDLTIKYPSRPAAPITVTSHIESRGRSTRGTLTKKFHKGVWPAPSLTGGWGFHTTSAPRLNELHAKAESCLGVLEAAGVKSFDLSTHQMRQIRYGGGNPAESSSVLDAEATLLNMGVIRASSYEPGAGGPIITLYPERGKWAWSGSADAVVTWINYFMAHPDRKDNLRQLQAVAQSEAHLAVYADISVDGNVWRALSDLKNTGVVPTVAPTLVAPVTHLWLFADPPGGTGLAWDPHRGWYRFSCVPPDEAQAQQ